MGQPGTLYSTYHTCHICSQMHVVHWSPRNTKTIGSHCTVTRGLDVVDRHACDTNSKSRILSTCKVYSAKRSTCRWDSFSNWPGSGKCFFLCQQIDNDSDDDIQTRLMTLPMQGKYYCWHLLKIHGTQIEYTFCKTWYHAELCVAVNPKCLPENT